MISLVSIISLSIAAKITEYRFGVNFGASIYDYSGKANTGTNSNLKSTDRGIYLDGSSNSVVLKNPSIPDTSSIVFWILPNTTTGSIICYGTENEYLIQIRSDNKALVIAWNLTSIIMTEIKSQTISTSGLATGSWTLVIAARKPTNSKLFGSFCSIYENTVSTYNSVSGVANLPKPGGTFSKYFFQIGGKGSMLSVKGFLWYFFITDSYDSLGSYYSTTIPESCVIGACINCEKRTIDPTYGSICLSNSLDWTKNKENSNCINSKGCSLSFSYTCSASCVSCLFNLATSTFNCIDAAGIKSTEASTPAPICLLPYVNRSNQCCSGYCASCLLPDYCSSCIDPNSISVAGVCSCKTGYFGLASKSTVTGCTKCKDYCQSCTSLIECTQCYDINAEVKSGVCVCKTGYAGTPAIALGGSGCIIPCAPLCASCSGVLCVKCVDSNAEVDGSNLCVCKSGFSGNPSSTSTVVGCLNICGSECMECGVDGICTKCFDMNAIVSLNNSCVCNLGYTGNPSTDSVNPGCIQSILCDSLCSSCNNLGICTGCFDHDSELNEDAKCVCKSGYKGTPSTVPELSGCTLIPTCSNDCLSCDDLGACSKCKDSFAVNLTNKCVCGAGYSGEPSKTEGTNSCHKCKDTCLNCNETICEVCKDSNAEVDGSDGCLCKDRYIGTPSSDQLVQGCKKNCEDECSSCNNTICEGCVDKNAHIKNGTCICKDDYFGKPATIFNSKGCNPNCPEACSSCNSPNICESCHDVNSKVSEGKCECLPGYSKQLFAPYSCRNCDIMCTDCDSLGNCLGCIDKNSILAECWHF